MLKLTYPDNTKAVMPMGVFAENKPFEVFVGLALEGISWEFQGKLQTGNYLHNKIKEADLRVRPSIFFLHGEHANAYTLH